jgi:hypothetical protein
MPAEPVWDNFATVISGFKTDSMTLMQRSKNTVSLEGNQIKNFTALTGLVKTDSCTLRIARNNRIDNARLQVNGHGHLDMLNLTIPHLSYSFSDDAIVTTYGKALISKP